MKKHYPYLVSNAVRPLYYMVTKTKGFRLLSHCLTNSQCFSIVSIWCSNDNTIHFFTASIYVIAFIDFLEYNIVSLLLQLYLISMLKFVSSRGVAMLLLLLLYLLRPFILSLLIFFSYTRRDLTAASPRIIALSEAHCLWSVYYYQSRWCRTR